MKRNGENQNILVTPGRERNIDAVSKGDWKQYRTNWICSERKQRCGVWTWAKFNFLTQSFLKRNRLKCDTHVEERKKVYTKYPEYGWTNFQPEYGCHLYPILNIIESDSEIVRWRKSEKNPWKEMKKSWNLVAIVSWVRLTKVRRIQRPFRKTGQGVLLNGKLNC